MRKLVIVRGPQASGKTTLVKNAGLEGFKISGDDIRKVRTGLVLNTQGNFVMNQEDGHEVWNMVFHFLKIHLSRGEFTVIEGIFPDPSEYDHIIEEALKNGYKIAIVDMAGLHLEELVKRDQTRPKHERMSLGSIERYFNRYKPHDVNDKRIDAIFGRDGLDEGFSAWISQPVHQLDNYDRIVHVGDFQGVFEAAFREGSPLTAELDEKTFYIFVGDALDRGIENDKVMKWILTEVRPRLGKNAVWIAGNHERHLADFIEGREIVSQEFQNRTLPQLIKINPSTADIRDFLSHMEDMFIYQHSGEHVVVTHAGLPAVPENPALVPAYQAMLGVSGFGENVDENFASWAQKQDKVWRQVHGHRNKSMLPTRVNEHSFNLEGQAEFGGHIRFAVKTKEGWETIEMRNNIYHGPREWRDINEDESRKSHGPVMPIPAWIERGEVEGYLSEETLAEFSSHKHVNIRTQESRPNVDTIAFSKTAFYSKTWDGITNKARGLFIDNRTRKIIARSWNKFFNLGERPEVELDLIASTWTYPMTMSLKDNGFLGLVSWDHEREEIVFSSKGSMDGEFADLFREVANEVLGQSGIERLGRAVRDLGGTAAFEVIHPEKDPHIVEYEAPDLVLLDFIRNAENFEKLDHKKLERLARYIGVNVRMILARIPNEQAFRSLVGKLSDPDSGLYKKHIEGVVIEDAEGRFVKVKSGWYSMWKHARGTVERLAIQRRRGEEIDHNISEEIEGFMHWIMAQDDSVTSLPIITLRKLYLERGDDAPVFDRKAMEQEREERARQERETKEIDGLLRGYGALLPKVRSATAPIESIRRLIERANEKPHLAEAIKKQPGYNEVIEYITKGESHAQ